MRNSGREACTFTLIANAYLAERGPWEFSVPPGGTIESAWPVSQNGNWYDLTVTNDAEPTFLRRFAGRMENGQDLISDPAAA